MKNKISNIKGFLIIFFIASFSLLILKITSKDKAIQEDNIDSFLVKTEKIILKNHRPEYLFYGNIQAQNQVDVISKLSGKIVNVSPKVFSNDYFEEGEKIIKYVSINKNISPIFNYN